MSIQSLESERQSILQRMQMSRDGYRHMLTEDTGEVRNKPAFRFSSPVQYGSDVAANPAADKFPRSMTMRVLTRHPVACSVAVALLLFVGPRRMARASRRSASKVTEVTARNRDNLAMVGRGVKLAAQFLPIATQYLRSSGAIRRR